MSRKRRGLNSFVIRGSRQYHWLATRTARSQTVLFYAYSLRPLDGDFQNRATCPSRVPQKRAQRLRHMVPHSRSRLNTGALFGLF